MKTMYDGKINSPSTTLNGAINNSMTSIVVTDASVLPNAPNLCTIGTGNDAETVLYSNIAGNTLTVTRGFQGTAKAWDDGTYVARNFTEYDYDALVDNVNELETDKVDKITGKGLSTEDYTTSEKNKLASINISSGTADPTGGSDGDIYLQYE